MHNGECFLTFLHAEACDVAPSDLNYEGWKWFADTMTQQAASVSLYRMALHSTFNLDEVVSCMNPSKFAYCVEVTNSFPEVDMEWEQTIHMVGENMTYPDEKDDRSADGMSLSEDVVLDLGDTDAKKKEPAKRSKKKVEKEEVDLMAGVNAGLVSDEPKVTPKERKEKKN